jgi:hypothetical protein
MKLIEKMTRNNVETFVGDEDFLDVGDLERFAAASEAARAAARPPTPAGLADIAACQHFSFF